MNRLHIPELSPKDKDGLRRIARAALGAVAITGLVVSAVQGCQAKIAEEIHDNVPHSTSTEQPDSIFDILDQ